MHPAYKIDDATSDLAIIKVINIDFTNYVQPICVWGPVFDKHKFYYKEATVSFHLSLICTIFIIMILKNTIFIKITLLT